MEITIKINLDNAAFEKNGNDVELSRILEEFARSCYFAKLEESKGNLRDVNGNKVGTWEVTE
jgi:hypothetical protein